MATTALFLKGIMDNERSAERNFVNSVNTVTGDGGEEFPGQPEGQVERDNNKGITLGYTATLSSTVINNFHFGYISQLINIQGLQTQPYNDFRGMDNINAFTPTINTHVPVKNIVDDVTKVIGSHTLQFGGNYREIDNLRESDAQNFFQGQTNVYWLNFSGISNTGSSLDPASINPVTQAQYYPAVDPDFSASYDFAMAALAGIITQINANYELTKTLNVIPQGQLVPRHFRNHEYEFYGQDQWRVKPNFTFTYGLRYSILQPPYETTGTQVSPTLSLNNWFNQRSIAAANGQVYDPAIGFGLSGQANGKPPYWAYDYKDFAPRFAFAYSPKGESGWSRRLWGGPGKTSIRAGYGIYFDHFGEGIINTFDREGSFGLTTAEVNPAGIQTVDGSARYSGLYNIPTSSNDGCATPPCSLIGAPPTGPFPVFSPSGAATPGGFAITWGLDDKLKTPYSHLIDFSITRELPSEFCLRSFLRWPLRPPPDAGRRLGAADQSQRPPEQDYLLPGGTSVGQTVLCWNANSKHQCRVDWHQLLGKYIPGGGSCSGQCCQPAFRYLKRARRIHSTLPRKPHPERQHCHGYAGHVRPVLQLCRQRNHGTRTRRLTRV